MRDYSRFTTDRCILDVKTIESVDLLQNYVFSHLPQRIDEAMRLDYRRLISELSKCTISSSPGYFLISKQNSTYLGNYRLALRKNGVFCRAHALYDHTEPIFESAFRTERETNFLSDTVTHGYQQLWYHLGLRRLDGHQNGGKHYHECLLALERRLSGTPDKDLNSDIPIILGPLSSSSAPFLKTAADWHAIKTCCVFPIAPVSAKEPGYRQAQMTLKSSNKGYISLEAIIPRYHQSVCWSRIPFVKFEPTTVSLKRVKENPKPSCRVVWDHLDYLAK